MLRTRCLLLLSLVAACGAPPSADSASEDGLTSLSARARTLTFQGVVYARAWDSDATIEGLIFSQTKTALGGLLSNHISVSSRELRAVDPASIHKKTVSVVDIPGNPPEEMIEVRYTYRDDAVVPEELATQSAIPMLLLSPGYQVHQSRILAECTRNNEEARSTANEGHIWYELTPASETCLAAVEAEQRAIDADQARVGAEAIPLSQVKRLYQPVTVSLGADKTNQGQSYPEYEQLFAGGVEKDKLVISMINGKIGHDDKSPIWRDTGYREWIDQLRATLGARRFQPSDATREALTIRANDRVYQAPSTQVLFDWAVGQGQPSGWEGDRAPLREAIAQSLTRAELTFEAPVRVRAGNHARDFRIVVKTAFVTSSESTPYREAMTTSDVFLYNGHSNLGYGPLDPNNFDGLVLPASYQLFFVDSCLSFNYYNRGFLPMKLGGTKKLDIVSNGLETPARESGAALGQFVAALIGGRQPSYRELLHVARATDALRVVDGEVDNVYDPQRAPLTVEDL